MALLAADYTIAEAAKRIDPDGKQAKIAEIMTREISLLLDMPFYPSNDIWSHKSIRRASRLSTGGWRGLNEYVPSEASQVDEAVDIIGICEKYASYDIEYINNMPDPRQSRLTEAKFFIEELAQILTSVLLYSNNRVNPKAPHGIAPRLNTLGRYVISGGGVANLTSIYVIGWGEDTVFGVYPKNSEGGKADGYPIIHTDLGERVDTNAAGHKLRVYEDNFKVKAGLVIRDPRCIGRVANINSATAATVPIEDFLSELIDRMKLNVGSKIYMNENLITACRIRMKNKNNVNFTPNRGTGLFGEPVLFFDEYPIRKIDSAILLNSEVAVV